MSTEIEIKAALDAHGKAIEHAMAKYDAQVADLGKADELVKGELRALSEKFESTITEIGQKMDSAKKESAPALSAGAEFVKSEQFKQLMAGQTQRARIEVKNTVTSGSTTVFPQQQPSIIRGSFAPLTIRELFRSIPVTSNMVNSLREASWTNDAAEVTEMPE